MKRLVEVSILFLLLLLTSVSTPLQAQDSDDYKDDLERYNLDYRMIRIRLIPGLSTNGFDADQFASKYSLNILAGYNGALENGFELGSLVNINKYYAHGGQIAGIGNYSGKKTAGIQLGGIFNYSGDDMQGIQIAGITNISREDMQGIQLSGILNWSDGYSQGIQFSGAVNISKYDMQGMFITGGLNIAGGNLQGIMASSAVNWAGNDMQGMMFSGLLNYSEMFQGIAAGTINVSRDLQGIQIGTINITEFGQGIQAGIINYGKDFKGAPVGLISYYQNGRSEVDLWTSDAGFTNLGVKLGTDKIYNMISVGYNPALDRDVWQVGWSIGQLREYKNHFTYSDFSIYKINEGDWTKDLNSLFKYRLLFGKDLGEGLQIYGGPTLNMLISRVEDSNTYTWYDLIAFGAKGRTYRFWIGYAFGVELF